MPHPRSSASAPRTSTRRLVSTAATLLTAALAGGEARADLADDATRVALEWTRRGAEIQRLAPLFVEHGRVKVVGIGDEDEPDAGCTTVLVLGERQASFVVGAGGEAPGDAEDNAHTEEGGPGEHAIASASGAAIVSRCGDERRGLDRIAILMSSPRAALEVVIARSSGTEVSVDGILPERVIGPMAPRGDPGRPLEPGSLPERIATFDQHTRSEGAEAVVSVSMAASAVGAGEFVLRVSEGCHRVAIMAEIPMTLPRRATDVDAEARASEGGKVLTRDRADSPDARLDFCAGSSMEVSIPYVGASGAVRVVAVDAVWRLPAAVPAAWGAEARGNYALALRRRGAPAPTTEPIFETIGVQGSTEIPVEVEPGACYVAAVALIRGEVRGMRFGAQVGDRSLQDQPADGDHGAVLAFCAEDETTAHLQVDLRGSAPWWSLSVWRTGGAP